MDEKNDGIMKTNETEETNHTDQVKNLGMGDIIYLLVFAAFVYIMGFGAIIEEGNTLKYGGVAFHMDTVSIWIIGLLACIYALPVHDILIAVTHAFCALLVLSGHRYFADEIWFIWALALTVFELISLIRFSKRKIIPLVGIASVWLLYGMRMNHFFEGRLNIMYNSIDKNRLLGVLAIICVVYIISAKVKRKEVNRLSHSK